MQQVQGEGAIVNTPQAISICCGTAPGDLRAAAMKLYEHCRETDLLYVDLIQWLGSKSDVLAALPPELMTRIEAFNARMLREKST